MLPLALESEYSIAIEHDEDLWASSAVTLIETLVLLKLYYHERVMYSFNCCLSRHAAVIKQLRRSFKFKFKFML